MITYCETGISLGAEETMVDKEHKVSDSCVFYVCFLLSW